MSQEQKKDKPAFASYKDAIKFIHRLHSERLGSSVLRAERMNYFLSKMGKPEKKLKVIHITGTSGKGSTSIIIASIIRAAGYKVGAHTSPHLQSVRERTQINGRYVTKSLYLEAANRAKRAYDKTVQRGSYGSPDYKQFLTAISLYIFVKKKVDVAVIEVGAGGYGDSTNVIIPIISVITNVGMDHIGSLGNTLEEIASVKAGIIKPKTIVVSGVTQKKPAQMIINRAKELKCRLITNKMVHYKVKKILPGYTIADIATKRFKGENLKIGLTGSFQVRNAVMAILVTNALAKREGFKKLNNMAIIRGLEKAAIPGRFEIVQTKPEVVLDGAHNFDKMKSFVKSVRKLYKARPINLIIGFKKGKDFEKMMKILGLLKPKRVIATEVTSKVLKPLDATMVFKSARAYFEKPTKITINSSPKKAVKEMIATVKPEEVVIVTGSLYLVGEVRHIWEEVD